MYKINYIKHKLDFNFPAGTSRGVMHQREVIYIILSHPDYPKKGIGECAPIDGLSFDSIASDEKRLQEICSLEYTDFELIPDCSKQFPALAFGFEMAKLDLESSEDKTLFPSAFTQGKTGIPINGLIWMGNKNEMVERVKQKIEKGFRCLKLKIGAINFSDEIDILKTIRKQFPARDLEIRLDANEAFIYSEALEKLNVLSQFEIHSIEQPIKQGQILEMAQLCKDSPLPIALDEELIGFVDKRKMKIILQAIRPSYIILKPTLLGGLEQSNEWIKLAEKQQIQWWVTSALESNIGLNCIAQWCHTLNTNKYQGLGTGMLFTNNVASPLEIIGEKLYYNPEKKWDMSLWEGEID